jgi:hypothetical protein
MPQQPIFTGLIIDEFDQPVGSAFVGEEPCYVVNDHGFRRHIPSEQVDRQIFEAMMTQVRGHEEQISEQTAKMLGQDDIFSRAMIANQLKNMDQQFEALLTSGIPENGRAYLGMMGFRVVINVHGEVIRIDQPSAPASEGDE